MPQRRWLWPCSESKALRDRYDQQVTYDPYPHSGHADVLLSGSEDELDLHQHRDKKRRIESLAQAYLNGKPLFIQSAALKGPFDRCPFSIEDKYANHVVGSPILKSARNHVPSKRLPLPASARAKPGRSKKRVEWDEGATLPAPVHTSAFFKNRIRSTTNTPEPPDHDEHSEPSSPIGATRAFMPLSPIYRSSGPAPAQEPAPGPGLEEAHALQPGFSVAALLARLQGEECSKHQMTAPSPDQSHESSAAAPIEAPTWTIAAPAGFTPINQPGIPTTSQSRYTAANIGNEPPLSNSPRHDVPATTHKAGSKSKDNANGSTSSHAAQRSKGMLSQTKPSKDRKQKYLEAVETHDNSPLIFRRKKGPRAKPIVPAEDLEASSDPHDIRLVKAKARRVLFNSSVNVPTQSPRPTKQPTSPVCASAPQSIGKNNIVPAIDMSFDQDSLAMNFDFIDQHTNLLLPASGEPAEMVSVHKQLRRIMRLSGASITASPSAEKAKDSTVSFEDEAEALTPSGDPQLAADTLISHEDNKASKGDGPLLGTVENPVDAKEDNLPVLSTQAAMEEAHRGLFDASSPLKALVEAKVAEQTTPGAWHENSSAQPTVITPFHEFNAKLAAEAPPEPQSQPTNTQAMFDNMSPFLSPEITKQTVREAKPRKKASFAPITEESDSMLGLLSPAAVSKTETNQMPTSSSAAARIQDHQQHDLHSAIDVETMLDERSVQQLETPVGASGTCADAVKEGSQRLISSPEIVLSQRTLLPASQNDRNMDSSEEPGRSTDVFSNLQASQNTSTQDLFQSKSSQGLRDIEPPSSKPRRTNSGKHKLSGQSKRQSNQRALFRKSLSQPEHSLGRPLRNRTSLSQVERLPHSSRNTSTSGDPDLTGSTTIADETLPEPQQFVIGRELPSSNVFKESLDHTPLGQATSGVSVPPTSGRSKQSLRTPASSFQAAQRLEDLDFDSTIESITQSILTPWDVESAMRTPVDTSCA